MGSGAGRRRASASTASRSCDSAVLWWRHTGIRLPGSGSPASTARMTVRSASAGCAKKTTVLARAAVAGVGSQHKVVAAPVGDGHVHVCIPCRALTVAGNAYAVGGREAMPAQSFDDKVAGGAHHHAAQAEGPAGLQRVKRRRLAVGVGARPHQAVALDSRERAVADGAGGRVGGMGGNVGAPRGAAGVAPAVVAADSSRPSLVPTVSRTPRCRQRFSHTFTKPSSARHTASSRPSSLPQNTWRRTTSSQEATGYHSRSASALMLARCRRPGSRRRSLQRFISASAIVMTVPARSRGSHSRPIDRDQAEPKKASSSPSQACRWVSGAKQASRLLRAHRASSPRVKPRSAAPGNSFRGADHLSALLLSARRPPCSRGPRCRRCARTTPTGPRRDR